MKTYLLVFLFTFKLLPFQPTEKTWVAIGDSITYLNDHKEETGNRVTKGYLSRVTAEMPSIAYINKGFNGWTSGGVAEKFDSLDIPSADIYTVFLGTNDWWAGRPIGEKEDYKANKGNSTLYGSFRIIIDKIKHKNPKANIILITPMQRDDFVYIADPKNNAHGSYKDKAGQSLEAFALAIQEIGKIENLKVIDLYHEPSLTLSKLVKFKKLRIPGTDQYKSYPNKESLITHFNPEKDAYPYPAEAIGLTYDGLHPSDSGNDLIAKRVIAEFKKLDQ